METQTTKLWHARAGSITQRSPSVVTGHFFFFVFLDSMAHILKK